MGDFEVEANEIFKQEADELTTVQNLEDGLNRFGYSKDDRITRRDLAIIYSKIKNEMEAEIFRLANSSSYSDAKEMRGRLTSIRKEFDDLQLTGAANIRNDQKEYFEKANHVLHQDLSKRHEGNIDELTSYFQKLKSDEDFFHTIQTDNLTQTISKIHKPKMRYSKRLIELFKAEYGLNKLNQYDDAIKVRKMINKILPIEEKKFYQNFERNLESKRIKLEKLQDEDNARLDEKILKMDWKSIRQRELEAKITEQRVKNHQKDMNHAHCLQEKLKAETSIKPSALWAQRENYQTTAALLRGQQLLDNARGKKLGVESVYADSLVERHDYVSIPQDTVMFNPRK